jgi:hypothetical protein
MKMRKLKKKGFVSDREENEAFCLAADEKEFALYFPANGNVKLNAPKGNRI